LPRSSTGRGTDRAQASRVRSAPGGIVVLDCFTRWRVGRAPTDIEIGSQEQIAAGRGGMADCSNVKRYSIENKR